MDLKETWEYLQEYPGQWERRIKELKANGEVSQEVYDAVMGHLDFLANEAYRREKEEAIGRFY